MKKILSVLLAFIAIFLLLPLPVFAATEVTQTVRDGSTFISGEATGQTRIYQSVNVTSSNVTIKQISLSLSKTTGLTGTATLKLYQTSGRTDTGGTLLWSQNLDVSTLTTSGVWYDYNMGNGYLVTTGHIRFGIEFTGGDATHHV